LPKTIKECDIQFCAKAIDDSDGHYRDTRSYFSAVDMGAKDDLASSQNAGESSARVLGLHTSQPD
jgi:hypothetical protein